MFRQMPPTASLPVWRSAQSTGHVGMCFYMCVCVCVTAASAHRTHQKDLFLSFAVISIQSLFFFTCFLYVYEPDR